MIELDGTTGEGGGQIVRSALALSIVSGKPFRMTNIRAKRRKPGLRRQHLTAVKAAARVGGAHVEGAELNSPELVFTPSGRHGGTYDFDVGTAGSASLVLQAILPALLVADAPSAVTIHGGTHNPWAPPFEFLRDAFLPVLHAMGAQVELELVRHGFYPAGGGELRATVTPGPLHPWTELPGSRVRRARALVANLPLSIGEREVAVVKKRLGWSDCKVEPVASDGPGNALVLTAGGTVVTAFGKQGVPAERVAKGAVREMRAFLDADVRVDTHLADQLLIPMALAGGGAFRTTEPSSHTRTNTAVIERFLPVRFEIAADRIALAC